MTRNNEIGETRIASADTTTPDAQPVYPHTMRLQRFLARAGVAPGSCDPAVPAMRVSPASLVLVM